MRFAARWTVNRASGKLARRGFSWGPNSALIYRFEDFHFDTDLRELTCAGEPRALEPQVMALLELLIANAERVISKDEIVEQIWNGRIVSDGSINSRVKLLRKALDDDGKQQRLIKTVHGQGFRFVGTARAEDSERGDDEGKAAPLALPDKPSIAVLPFDNMSNDPEQDFLADGICEDILTAPLQNSPALRDRAQFELFLQGRRRRYPAGRSRAWGALCARRQRQERRRRATDYGAAYRCDYGQACMGRSL